MVKGESAMGPGMKLAPSGGDLVFIAVVLLAIGALIGAGLVWVF